MTTAAERRPLIDAYWLRSEPGYVEPGFLWNAPDRLSGGRERKVRA